MAIPNEALAKLIQEIETKAATSQQHISLARTQLNAKQRESRLLRLTMGEIEALPQGTNVYEGVGRMFKSLPLPELGRKLGDRVKETDSQIDKLNTRLLYLETTHKNSRDHIDQMLQQTSY